MMWMPHDDSFPPEYVAALVEQLEGDSDAVLAFGDIEPVDVDGAALPSWFGPPPFAGSARWTIRESLRLLFWHPAVPFRGVFRRAAALERGLWVPDTPDTIGADACWVFAMSLAGRLTHVPGCVCRKRYHPGSASARFRPTRRHVMAMARRLRAAVDQHALKRDRLWGRAGVAAWTAWWLASLPARRLPAPAKWALKRMRYGITGGSRTDRAPRLPTSVSRR
jgi:hypothetical protein